MHDINMLLHASFGGVSFSTLVALKLFDPLMSFHVSIIVALVVKGFSTYFTIHSLFLHPLELFWTYGSFLNFMLHFMGPEAGWACKFMTAFLTIIRPLSAVCSHVIDQLWPTDETLASCFTTERLLSSMLRNVVPH